MKLLFDQGVPIPLRGHLANHVVEAAFEKGWSAIKNGDLLVRAEKEGFDALVTTDQNLRYQQNLADRKIGIVVLMTTSWPRIQNQIASIVNTIDHMQPGIYLEIPVR